LAVSDGIRRIVCANQDVFQGGQAWLALRDGWQRSLQSGCVHSHCQRIITLRSSLRSLAQADRTATRGYSHRGRRVRPSVFIY
jgi:hypothetical protein